MQPERIIQLVRQHLQQHGFSQIEVDVRHAYPWAKMNRNDAPVQALIQTYHDLGYEPEIWPHMGESAPFYLFTDVLKMPLVMGGLGQGGRPHSANEYATVEGMKLFEKSIASFLFTFADQS